ncbi:hypothetical protein OBBRIDRAFT_820109 [Obba rivulosa]|uniref:CHCH domain-containing protein n=1 Tax=Obba rivulosa TaxID=1052685 RepID=A0A8E2DMX3_9APHY|nr:hypothetical protein OBBRIDRAFT_820109 [Obba rivulosa]
MSFGRPPSISSGFKPTPPDRGSFPLDHFGECTDYMKVYLDCLKKNTNNSSPCRHLNKDYLECRMNRGLMDRDEWKNLGLGSVSAPSAPNTSSSPPTSSTSKSSPNT